MISLIGIGVDEGNISFNALKAIKDLMHLKLLKMQMS